MAESINNGTEQEELTTLNEGWVDLVEYLIEETSSMSRFRTQPHTEAEAEAMCMTICQEERDQLTATDLNKLRSKATQEMTTKFSMLPMMDTDDQLANAYNVAMRIKEFDQKLKAYNMKDVFNLVIPILRHDGNIEPNRVMLTEAYNDKDMTEEMVRNSLQFFRCFGQEHDLQNLQWKQELLENSCEPELHEKVLEKMLRIPDIEMDGPTFFYLIISTTKDAVRSLTK